MDNGLYNEDLPPIWEGFCSALNTEYRPAKEIVGQSGMSHPVEAIGVDEKENRLIVISSEHNARVASLLKVDIQASMPSMRVMVARPMVIDLAFAAKTIFFNDRGAFDIQKLQIVLQALQSTENSENLLKDKLEASLPTIFTSLKRSALPIRTHVFNVIDQLAAFDWDYFLDNQDNEILQLGMELLTRFAQMDNFANDRKQGICPVPTYEFSEQDWDLFATNNRLEDIQERLKIMNIYQYFYPPMDGLTLGLVDHGFNSVAEVAKGVSLAKANGHQVSENEFIQGANSPMEVIEALEQKGYLLDGEFHTELTSEGQSLRSTVKFRPSESIFSKISRIVKLNVDLNLKDFIDKAD